MKIDNEILDQYINGELSEEDKIEFDLVLENEPASHSLYKDHLNTIEGIEWAGAVDAILETDDKLDQEGFFMEEDLLLGIESAGEKEMRDAFLSVEENLENESFFESKKSTGRVIRLGRRQSLAIAASFALLLVAGWWLFLKAPTNEALYADFYNPYQDDLSEKIQLDLSETGFADVEKTLLESMLSGLDLYEKENYHEAIDVFARIENDNPGNRYTLETRMYHAMSLLALGETDSCIEKLQQLVPLLDGKMNSQASYYLALAYLKQNETDKAKKILNSLISDEVLGESAKKLISKIN